MQLIFDAVMTIGAFSLAVAMCMDDGEWLGWACAGCGWGVAAISELLLKLQG